MRYLVLFCALTFVAAAADKKPEKSSPKSSVMTKDELQKLHEIVKNSTKTPKGMREALEKFFASLPKERQNIVKPYVLKEIAEFNNKTDKVKKIIAESLNKEQLKSVELLLTDLHNKDAKPKEVVEAVYEKLIEILGNKKAKEMMEKIAAIFKIPHD
ncbi:unnamed protein product [Enterobius vermicularis]|uniref:Fatty-acid and retinol-binding protein 1 n=1 Tax=Enterobius vermicularis TaxID=51028 RepID=A0A0N4UTW3_ENTVE|nr:unnamed protein product [Enterobius vermicularis]